VVGKRFGGECVELSGSSVVLDLPVPRSGVKFSEPEAKLGKLGGRQGLNGLLDGLYVSHVVDPICMQRLKVCGK
jgi:hypothetical protein